MENKEFINDFYSNNNLEMSKKAIYAPAFPETQTQSSLPVKLVNTNGIEQQYKNRTSSIIIRKIIKGVFLFMVGLVVFLFIWRFNCAFGGDDTDISKHF